LKNVLCKTSLEALDGGRVLKFDRLLNFHDGKSGILLSVKTAENIVSLFLATDLDEPWMARKTMR
jgi:hypothetical protein